MTTRTTAIGLLALVGGLALIAATDAAAFAVLGLALSVAGGVISLLALLGGTHDSPEATLRGAVADAARDAGAAAHTKTAADTGRWPRVIGGG